MGLTKVTSMTKSSLLLDADVIIDLHENGCWRAVLATSSVAVGSVVAGEAEFYEDGEGVNRPIELQSYIDRREIRELDASPEQMSLISSKLRQAKLILDPGELECIAILESSPSQDLRLCLKEQAAIKAVSFLELDEKAVCLGEVLTSHGIRRAKGIPYEHSKKRFDKFVLEGRLLLL